LGSGRLRREFWFCGIHAADFPAAGSLTGVLKSRFPAAHGPAAVLASCIRKNILAFLGGWGLRGGFWFCGIHAADFPAAGSLTGVLKFRFPAAHGPAAVPASCIRKKILAFLGGGELRRGFWLFAGTHKKIRTVCRSGFPYSHCYQKNVPRLKTVSGFFRARMPRADLPGLSPPYPQRILNPRRILNPPRPLPAGFERIPPAEQRIPPPEARIPPWDGSRRAGCTGP